MDFKHVTGKDRGKIVLYAISTCVWCKKTKKLLNDLGVDYYYVDVDLLNKEDKEEVKNEVKRWNPRGSYPTIVINSKKCVQGYDPLKIKELLGYE